MVYAPPVRYAKSDDVHIAYQIIGEGPMDLLFVPGFVSHLEAVWQNAQASAFLRRLASFGRLILFDKRGTGMSDRGSQIFTLEQRMHDVQAILDEVGSKRAALIGVSEGGPMSLLYSATYPARTSALILFGSYAKRSWAPDYQIGWKPDQWEQFLAGIERNWGTPEATSVAMWAPGIAANEGAAERLASFFRMAASPGAALAIMRMNREIDVRDILPAITVPTLILHRTGDRVIELEHARYMAKTIPGANLIELPGEDHMWWVRSESALDRIEQFLTGRRTRSETERILTTVLFTDIVGSTERAARLGDKPWRELLESFYANTRETLREYRGREINTAGDGFFAAFDGPARAVRCAAAIRKVIGSLGFEVRTGIHTGECEVMGDDLAGIAVHIGARVAGQANPGEILVSQTVRDLVAGSGLAFEDRGMRTLKGVPNEWHLYRALVD